MGLRNRKNQVDLNNNVPKDVRPPWYPSIPRVLKRQKIVPSQDQNEARNLSANYSEHTWDLETIIQNHPESGIDKKSIQQSRGLSSGTANDLLLRNGPNALPKPVEVSDIRLFIKQFLNLLWILLLVTDVLSLISWIADTSNLSQLWVTLIIFVMIFGMCCISFKHERDARRVVAGFQNLLPDNCVVIRDGKELTISAEELVVGDIIWIKNGTKVPADARVLYCSQLKLETSSITGEVEPIEYQIEAVAENVTVFESHNVVFNGSLCVDGEGVAIVIRTATDTVIGQIAHMTTGQVAGQSRLQKQMRRFIIFLIVRAAVLGLLVFVIGGFVHKWKSIFVLLANGFVACAIGMVPVGMPATVTSIIALIARRLAKKNVFLKRLDIVESLGSANIIASDKTGTLTKNVMTVTDAWFYNEFINGFPQRKANSSGKGSLKDFDTPINDLLDIMVVCNASKFLDEPDKMSVKMPKFDSDVEKGQETGRLTSGAPSEVAMLKYADRLIDIDAARRNYDIIFEIPFNSKRKWHLMIARIRDMGDGMAEYKLLIKGASEILVKKCNQIMTRDGTVDLDEEAMNHFQAAYETFGSNGRRVIGFCYKNFVAPDDLVFDWEKENVPLFDLTFVGICAIMDPPRDETAAAIRECRSAGIKVFMVTGDHYLTAAAIAREIGLVVDEPGKPKDYEILHGEKISNLTDSEWDELIKKHSLVFARTTPEQKLLIVEQCQKRKQIIAMTGDGVNDAPALKKADIGIAMGSGSDVAKQAADVILMDDNFASIVKGVEYGRNMFEQIKKLLAYLALHSFPEVWPIILNFCFGMPLGLTSLQILSIDLGTEIMPGISMAREPGEGDIMQRPPRRRNKVLISNTLLFYSYVYAGFIQSAGAFLCYCIVFWSHGIAIKDLWMSALTHWQENAPDFHSNGHVFTWEEQLMINRKAASAWQMGIVLGQAFHLLNVRTRRQSIFTHGVFKNWQSIIAIIVSMIMLNIMIYVPAINHWFGGAPISIYCWLMGLAAGLFMFWFNEGRKFLIRTYPKNWFIRFFKW